MAKKQSIVSEIGSALGAVAARAEKLIAPTKPAKKTTTAIAAKPAASPATKPAAKRTVAAKHSKVASTPVETKVVAVPVAAVAPVVISHDAIAQLAYSYWEARGYQPGNPGEDWARAEAELKQRSLA
jgi:hypothetical protein